MAGHLTEEKIRQENRSHRDTGGRSQENRHCGFKAAFLDLETGRVELSCYANGIPAAIHLLCGMPQEWVVARDGVGNVIAVKPSIVSGFVRSNHFYTREEAARAMQSMRAESVANAEALMERA